MPSHDLLQTNLHPGVLRPLDSLIELTTLQIRSKSSGGVEGLPDHVPSEGAVGSSPRTQDPPASPSDAEATLFTKLKAQDAGAPSLPGWSLFTRPLQASSYTAPHRLVRSVSAFELYDAREGKVRCGASTGGGGGGGPFKAEALKEYKVRGGLQHGNRQFSEADIARRQPVTASGRPIESKVGGWSFSPQALLWRLSVIWQTVCTP